MLKLSPKSGIGIDGIGNGKLKEGSPGIIKTHLVITYSHGDKDGCRRDASYTSHSPQCRIRDRSSGPQHYRTTSDADRPANPRSIAATVNLQHASIGEHCCLTWIEDHSGSHRLPVVANQEEESRTGDAGKLGTFQLNQTAVLRGSLESTNRRNRHIVIVIIAYSYSLSLDN